MDQNTETGVWPELTGSKPGSKTEEPEEKETVQETGKETTAARKTQAGRLRSSKQTVSLEELNKLLSELPVFGGMAGVMKEMKKQLDAATEELHHLTAGETNPSSGEFSQKASADEPARERPQGGYVMDKSWRDRGGSLAPLDEYLGRMKEEGFDSGHISFAAESAILYGLSKKELESITAKNLPLHLLDVLRKRMLEKKKQKKADYVCRKSGRKGGKNGKGI